ncbi:MAG TPA: sigma-70 family RNA polymerase sigma factor [Tepidisphaeraceae bacterium]|jgi:RNA polymerase sigma-70 factor (ECF subfamily)|nr:sigma-70 family RNA polymerase sigma factor [Tepidisphaeraceae bacterium]
MNPKPPANPLAHALADGEPAAYEALYQALAGRMLRVAEAMLGNVHCAEDAVQDVFVNLARARGRLAIIADLEAYVFSSLRHAIAGRAAAAARERQHLRRLAAGQTGHAPMLPEAHDDLGRALASLPQGQREVIALKVDADLTFAQIATVLQISPNTAASRYRYAMEKLHEKLGDSDERPRQ